MDRYTQSREIYKQLFRQLPDENESNGELMEILRRFIFADVFHSGELDLKTRELVTVTCLATMQTLPQLKAHINACLNVGAQPVEIREALYQLAPFVGFPKTLNAVAVYNEVLAERKITLPAESSCIECDENRFAEGSKIQQPLYGDEILQRFASFEKVPRFLTEWCFGDFYTRKGLDLPTRELLTLVTLTALNMPKQVAAHLKGNLRVGNSVEKLYWTMLQCMPYVGFPAVANTLNALLDIVSQRQ